MNTTAHNQCCSRWRYAGKWRRRTHPISMHIVHTNGTQLNSTAHYAWAINLHTHTHTHHTNFNRYIHLRVRILGSIVEESKCRKCKRQLILTALLAIWTEKNKEMSGEQLAEKVWWKSAIQRNTSFHMFVVFPTFVLIPDRLIIFFFFLFIIIMHTTIAVNKEWNSPFCGYPEIMKTQIFSIDILMNDEDPCQFGGGKCHTNKYSK